MPDEGRSRPELDSQRLALIVQHVADYDLRTLRYQQAGLRGTLAARPAAHEHHLVVEACHVRFPRLPTRKFGRSQSPVQHLLMLGHNRCAAVGPGRLFTRCRPRPTRKTNRFASGRCNSSRSSPLLELNVGGQGLDGTDELDQITVARRAESAAAVRAAKPRFRARSRACRTPMRVSGRRWRIQSSFFCHAAISRRCAFAGSSAARRGRPPAPCRPSSRRAARRCPPPGRARC